MNIHDCPLARLGPPAGLAIDAATGGDAYLSGEPLEQPPTGVPSVYVPPDVHCGGSPRLIPKDSWEGWATFWKIALSSSAFPDGSVRMAQWTASRAVFSAAIW
jgi:hypothetical protein